MLPKKKKVSREGFLIEQMEVKVLKQILSQLFLVNAELYTNAFSQEIQEITITFVWVVLPNQKDWNLDSKRTNPALRYQLLIWITGHSSNWLITQKHFAKIKTKLL